MESVWWNVVNEGVELEGKVKEGEDVDEVDLAAKEPRLCRYVESLKSRGL